MPARKSQTAVLPLTDNPNNKEMVMWQRFWQEKSQALRSKIVEFYTSYTDKLSSSLYTRYRFLGVDLDDFIQTGREGLLTSVDRYTDKGATFRTYVSYRIRGAILNEMPKYTDKNQQYQQQTEREEERVTSIFDENTSEDSDKFGSLLSSVIEVAIGVIIDQYDVEDEEPQSSPYQQLENNQLKNQLVGFISQLNHRDAQILSYHYFYEYSFSDIASVLNITRGRVSQVHARALKQIKLLYDEENGLNHSI